MMMKRAALFVFSALGVAVLAGCPIYSDDTDRDHRVCIGGECYDCPDAYYSSACTSWTCYTGSDCPSGYACNTSNRCTLGAQDGGGVQTCAKPSDCPPGSTCAADNVCRAGDCSTTGCPANYTCKLANGAAQCVAAADGGAVSSCKADAECASTPGSKCLTGECVPPSGQCADATQCAAGAVCVDGSCTPACSATKACPTGYGCDLGKGVCTQNPTSCTSSTQCTGGSVCVDQHCVAPCGEGATCPAGLVCLDGGCTPDERPVFVCNTEGVQDSCQPGSLCLRHSCYIACSSEAGTEACKSADTFNVCKAVTTGSGTYEVCGSSSNLGTECDPTQGKNCSAPEICIDGFCR